MGKTPIKHTLAGYIIKKTDTEYTSRPRWEDKN